MKRIALLSALLATGCLAQVTANKTESDIGIDQKLDAQIPLELPFVDESGKTVKLGDYFGQVPVVLSLVYYGCPDICPMVLENTADALKTVDFAMGKQYAVVTVSINPVEKPVLAAKSKAQYVARYQKPGAKENWHFLTGSEVNIKALAKAVGYRYAYDADTKQFAHPVGLIVLTPEGHISRYLMGVDYNPRDLRFALVDASANRIGTLADKALLFCYHYDPTTGKYGLAVTRMTQAGGVLTLFILGIGIFVMSRKYRTKPLTAPPMAEPPAAEV